MKTTRETLRISLENVSLSLTDAEVLYNWSNLSSYTNSTPTTYIFNNCKTLSETFIDESSQSQPSTRAVLGINKGTTSNAINNTAGEGTFAGTDLIKLSKDQELDDWTILINFEYTGCPADASKRRIIFHNYSSTTNTGFKIGINGTKNLFFEYYDSTGTLETHTLEKVLSEKNAIAISNDKNSKTANMYLYNPLDSSNTSKSIVLSNNIAKGNEWYLGGLNSIPSASSFDQMFVGKIYEFILLNTSTGESEIKSIFDSMFCSDITEDTVGSTTETYYVPVSFADQQVQTGTTITGYTSSQTTIVDGNGVAQTFYEETPVTAPVYENKTVYTNSSTPSTRTVDQFIDGVKTFVFSYIEKYAPTCLLLKSPDGTTSYEYQITTNTKYTSDLNNSATFNASDGSFTLKEDYGSSKTINVFINGLFVESGADYTRSTINIKKYTGKYTESDTCVYDIVENGTTYFVDFTAAGDLTLNGKADHDVFLDGKRLKFGTDFIHVGSDLKILSSQVPAGRLAVISRHANFSEVITGTITTFICPSGKYLISESLWLDGIRKKNADYLLNNSCDLANSTTIVPQKSTVIYENQSTYYNI
tara:strand:- start:364 stop:2133 length:1770 start_codon:yes stop_codon:yes gene_type:complete